ncbi:hypothetical protein CEXT_644961 [Caerostris extrusa]|uniref:Uncharacterized protein n=1 Tax=Caerostris extrusa TaxID=172846 RepID=A0AAV4RAY0_CAEEX|nr:hypothetical protein CEXT_644961 [Caerostris extrusa]
MSPKEEIQDTGARGVHAYQEVNHVLLFKYSLRYHILLQFVFLLLLTITTMNLLVKHFGDKHCSFLKQGDKMDIVTAYVVMWYVQRQLDCLRRGFTPNGPHIFT